MLFLRSISDSLTAATEAFVISAQDRSASIATFALCGFANPSSIGEMFLF